MINENMKRSNVPAGEQQIILYDRNNSNKPVKYTTTDMNGNFSFSLPVESNYGIHVDIPGNDIDTSFSINLSAGNNVVNNLFIFIDTSIISFELATGVENTALKMPSTVLLFPNPSKDILHLSANDNEEYQVSIYLEDGKLLDGFTFKKQKLYNIKDLTQGIIFVKICNGFSSKTTRIIVK